MTSKFKIQITSRFALLAVLLVVSVNVLAKSEFLDRIVAVANQSVITESAVNEKLKVVYQQLRERKTNPPSKKILRQQVMERLIIEQLQLDMADRLGIKVDDATLNRAMRSLAKGNNLSLTQFRQALEQEGFGYNRFRENIRNEVIISRLRKRQINDRVSVTDREVDTFLQQFGDAGAANQEFELGHILIAVPEASSPERIQSAFKKASDLVVELRSGAAFKDMAVANSDGSRALEGGSLGWLPAARIPTLFAKTVTSMQPGNISDPIRSASGFHIIKLLSKKGGVRHLVKQALSRHILLRTNELLTDERAEQKLTDLRDRILGGEDFANLAQANSDDPGSAANGGMLPWSSPGELVPAFEEAMNRLQPDQISPPFQTRYGWHIVQLLDKRELDNTKQYQRSQARKKVFERKVGEELQRWLRRLRDEAYIEFFDVDDS